MAIVKIQFRRDTTSNWITENPILASGEPAYDTELKTFKIGDGTTDYISLPNALGGGTGGVISGSSQLDGSTFTNIIASGSFSGSYVGDGSGLSGVTSYTDADTLNFINSQQVLSGSYQVTGSTAVHVQAVSAETWSFNHNLGQEWPPIQVYDENRYVLIPSNIKSVDENNTEIHFSPAQAGYASATVGGEPMGNAIVEHLQLTASVSWSVNHNLGKLNPIITVYDGSGEVAQPFRIQPIDENNLNVLWTTPESGSVSLGGKLVSFNSVSGSDVALDTTNFGNNISSSDDTVQKAMETINSLSLGISGNGIISGSSQLDGTTINNLSGSFSGSFQGDGSGLTGVASGDVTKVGTPVNEQIGIWTGDGTIEGDTRLNFTKASSTLKIGISNTTRGILHMLGSTTTTGGAVSFYNGATQQSNDTNYNAQASNGTFVIGGAATGTFLNYTSATQVLDFPKTTTFTNASGSFSGSFHGTTILNVTAPAITGRENIIVGKVSDNSSDLFSISNGTTTAGRFIPTFVGYTSGSYQSLLFRGLGNIADDSGATPAFIEFLAANTGNSSDPNNGTLYAPSARPLFKWGTVGATAMEISATKELSLPSYGGGVITGSATYNLGVDVNGNVIETALPTVSKVGTPVNDQIAIWTGNGTIEGTVNATIAGSSLTLGKDETTSNYGILSLRGSNSFSGGFFAIYHGANADSYENAWIFEASNVNSQLQIRGSFGGSYINLDGVSSTVQIRKAITSNQSIANINSTGPTSLTTKQYVDNSTGSIANTIASGSFSGSFQGSGTGNFVGTLISTVAPPTSISGSGTQGEIRTDSDYIYVCITTNSWKRAALSTW